MDLDRKWAQFAGRERLNAEVGNPDLARGIFYGVGAQAFEWLDTPIPALDGRSPRACLKTRSGRQLLGTIVARFPR